MKYRIPISMLAAAIVAVAGHAGEDTAMARGAELLAPFKKNLMQALQSGLQQGPADAISACRDKAAAEPSSSSARCPSIALASKGGGGLQTHT